MRTCMNCKWSRWRGPHLGCFYKGSFHGWLRQKKAQISCCCEAVGHSLHPLAHCKWEPKEEKHPNYESLSQLLDSEELLLSISRDTNLSPEIVSLVLIHLKERIKNGALQNC